MGDRVLGSFAATLQTAVGGLGNVFRVGGEEFAVLCPALSVHQASHLATRLVRVVADQARVSNERGEKLRITCSIGYATHDGTTFDRRDQLLKAADRGLYAAKSAGRNCARRGELTAAAL